MLHYPIFNRSKVAFTVMMACAFLGSALCDIDPKVVLAGVKAQREQIPPSALELRVTFQTTAGGNESDFNVIFDGARRMFLSTNDAVNSRILFDGTQVYRFDGSSPGAVTIRNPDTQLPDPLFDPRLLGITTSYSWDQTLDTALGGSWSSLSIVGREMIHGISTLHIRGDRRGESHMDLWVVPEDKFAVLKVVEVAEGIGSRTTLSTYGKSSPTGLPTKVETFSNDASGTQRYSQTCEIGAHSTHLVTSNSSWTLNALLGGIKTSTWIPVTDVRSRKVVGYWRDGELGPPYPWAHEPKRPVVTEKRLVSLVGILLLVAVVYLYGGRVAWKQFKTSRST